ncbi:prolyl oligopeptidase family serine peptidase [Kribbella sp. CA-293567]|uniref:prolyl oligopeptidase family serine peptidase n=1 Tax=Kribbella sp. CA-293567 TaxID=3002436 RepID=UPI0022DD9534|nr:prolyl oligopeptidase family serine peptidase [Kribbella sp. CA-293567]WBQ06593.1 prolyl oligopeptidase family serine peptidase [Kribbella sp. CA-293567]
MDISAFPAQWSRTRRFSLGLPRAFTLSPDGQRVLFLRTRGAEDATSCLWLLAGTEEHLLAAPESLGEDGPLPPAEAVRRERARESAAGIVAYTADVELRTVAFALNGALWTLTLDPSADSTAGSGIGSSAQPQCRPTAGPVVDPRLDPTGQRVAYVTDGSLRVLTLATGNDQLVASDDDPEVTWGLAEHVASESMHRTRGHWWSPDGTHLLTTRVDLTPVQRWWIADPANPARPPREIAYPAAGTANALVSLHAFDLTGSSTRLQWDSTAYEYLAAVAWDSHGPLLAVQSRDQRTLQVLAADPSTGRTHLLHEQRDPAWVELVPGTPARTASGKLVHPEDLGETRHLTIDGRQVTPEGLQLREVLAVQGESVLFLASNEPTESHLWLYQQETLHQLSDVPGAYDGLRAGGTLLLSSNTEAGRTFVVRREGQPDHPIASHRATPVVTPRITWLQAGDLRLRTALLLPSWYQPGVTKLPVLMAPYGGPAMSLVLKVTAPWFHKAQWYAEAGFAVVIADGRGTPGRGPVWEKTVHRDTLSAPIADQITALHAAAEYSPDLDLTRVGITGWSYGGLLAAAAVLRRPDVFHAAVSGAAPSDQRLYDTHWRERFLGHPDEHPEDYDRSSPINDAAKLERPLLLVHGLADDNVIAAHTLRFSAALLAAGRPHQVMPLSNATHRVTDEAAVRGLMLHELDFLRTALLAVGEQPGT